jgi:hypothetical protein
MEPNDAQTSDKEKLNTALVHQKHLQVARVKEIILEAGENGVPVSALSSMLEVTPPYLGHQKAIELAEAMFKAGLIYIETKPDGSEVFKCR